jgi:hypothetical protein
LHGAHADRADKHGVTLEMHTWENREEVTAEVWEWLANKNRDLRESEGKLGSESASGAFDC